MVEKLKLGFACAWWTPRASTWSGTAPAVKHALERQPVDLVSIESQRSTIGKVAFKALYAPMPTPWKYSRLHRAMTARAVRRAARAATCDAVISVGDDDSPAGPPSFVYQDMNFSVALAHMDRGGPTWVNVMRSSRSVLERLDREQRWHYGDLAGVLAMGRWFGDWLVEHVGVPRGKVHVVGAGISPPAEDLPAPRRHGRLLFIGVDFERKGGDQVVEAVRRLRQRGTDVTLSVVGPRKWPMQDPVPSGVEFLGHVGGDRLEALWADADLLVVPSRFEAYGKVFSEALAAGRPCIGRRSYAMPELIGDGGLLVEPDAGADELVSVIPAALDDDALYDRVWRSRTGVRQSRSWDAVASRIVSVVQQTLKSGYSSAGRSPFGSGSP
jgi:glycosyltransferase involved in cell wall biosynthesis